MSKLIERLFWTYCLMIFPSNIALDPRILGRIYKNTTATYKFYWFISILDILLRERRKEMSFREIIAGMVAEAWYPVHYFRLSFGKSDSMYDCVLKVQQKLNIPISTSKSRVKDIIIREYNDLEIKQVLNVLTLNVPYRFLSPWIVFESSNQVIEASNKYHENCLYSISSDKIIINPAWEQYLIENYTVLRDYTFWGLANFIQKRNPNVPNIPAKLQQVEQRSSLNKQKQFWDTVIDISGASECIYTGVKLNIGEYSLDHFIPWSFVTHDFLWNLMPVFPADNISKGNSLPPLEKYLQIFSQHQQHAIQTIYHSNPNNKQLEDYLMLHSSISELTNMIENDFFTVFYKTFSPMVQIAENMGFTYWNR
ncbi:MAG: HNH endonuclease domain-containing protein [Proteiniphilum sp.]|uniref:HNH endonuclease domain-containing protein n=1 Tax=Proteiniphilum sp. TaxID=1926877 RepID=UPI002B205097|nr:HNH endonuclease domain-containing protein [Proteiniphilum sp.]MEA5126913.1 HNH endonuclease domain-containing protein [Proteiniphilum sp.]